MALALSKRLSMTPSLTISNFSAPPHIWILPVDLVVENCGPNKNFVEGFLTNTRFLAARILIDSAIFRDAPYGFQSIFKTDRYLRSILQAMQYIKELPGRLNIEPNPDVETQPRFACVNSDAAQIYQNLDLEYDPWEECQTGAFHRPDLPDAPIRSFYGEGTAYIFLCPKYFTRPTLPGCPEVQNKQFVDFPGNGVPDAADIQNLGNLYRFYFGDTVLNAHSDPPEVFDWNRIVQDLDDIDSALNPTSIQAYGHCECFSRCPPAKWLHGCM